MRVQTIHSTPTTCACHAHLRGESNLDGFHYPVPAVCLQRNLERTRSCGFVLSIFPTHSNSLQTRNLLTEQCLTNSNPRVSPRTQSTSQIPPKNFVELNKPRHRECSGYASSDEVVLIRIYFFVYYKRKLDYCGVEKSR